MGLKININQLPFDVKKGDSISPQFIFAVILMAPFYYKGLELELHFVAELQKVNIPAFA